MTAPAAPIRQTAAMASEARCLCGEAIEEGLAQLGSVACHSCRSDAARWTRVLEQHAGELPAALAAAERRWLGC